MHRLILSLGFVFALTACNMVPDACLELQDELSFPYSFATYEAAGRSHDEWRTDLRQELIDAITFPSEPRLLGPPVLIGESLIDGTQVLEFELESEVDGVPIPSIGHEVDPDAVLAALPLLPGG